MSKLNELQSFKQIVLVCLIFYFKPNVMSNDDFFLQSLAEKGGENLETVTAHDNFFLLATMNPGGDYGKKELSPALRNRFTEIWVPPVSDLDELRGISKRYVGSLRRFEKSSIDRFLSFK